MCIFVILLFLAIFDNSYGMSTQDKESKKYTFSDLKAIQHNQHIMTRAQIIFNHKLSETEQESAMNAVIACNDLNMSMHVFDIVMRHKCQTVLPMLCQNIQLLCEQNIIPALSHNRSGWIFMPFFHEIVLNASKEMLDIFELMINQVHKTGELQMTPLHYAAQHNELAYADVLLAHGADRNARDARNKIPRDLAIEQGNRTMVGLLLQESIHDEYQACLLSVIHGLNQITNAKIQLIEAEQKGWLNSPKHFFSEQNLSEIFAKERQLCSIAYFLLQNDKPKISELKYLLSITSSPAMAFLLLRSSELSYYKKVMGNVCMQAIVTGNAPLLSVCAYHGVTLNNTGQETSLDAVFRSGLDIPWMSKPEETQEIGFKTGYYEDIARYLIYQGIDCRSIVLRAQYDLLKKDEELNQAATERIRGYTHVIEAMINAIIVEDQLNNDAEYIKQKLKSLPE